MVLQKLANLHWIELPGPDLLSHLDDAMSRLIEVTFLQLFYNVLCFLNPPRFIVRGGRYPAKYRTIIRKREGWKGLESSISKN